MLRAGYDVGAVNREDVLSVLEAHRPDLQRRFGIASLDLFGSFARGQAREDSDIDLLVRFDGPASLSCKMEMQDYLEGLFGRPVDLVRAEALRPEYRSYVEKDIAMDESDRSLRGDLEKCIDRVEQCMDRMESGLVEVKEGLAEIRGELGFVRDYILRRNAPTEQAGTERPGPVIGG